MCTNEKNKTKQNLHGKRALETSGHRPAATPALAGLGAPSFERGGKPCGVPWQCLSIHLPSVRLKSV